MISIKNLCVTVEAQPIIKHLNFNVQPGTVHALMGPNGSGKSTLAYTLLGHPAYEVTDGSIVFDGQEITTLATEKRAQLGIFLAFQYPYEIPGLNVLTYLKEIYTSYTKKSLATKEFYELVKGYLTLLGLSDTFLERGLNEGFSGGEKKRFEMLQLLLVQPRLVVLDEIDSGLDIDALKIVADTLATCKQANPAFTVIIITHYQRILQFIQPDHVHIFYNGAIVESGDLQLANDIEAKGYHGYIG